MILQLLGTSERRLRGSQISRLLAIPISSCMALLATAVGRGFVAFDEGDRSYALNHRISLTYEARAATKPLKEAVIACARRLHRELGLGVAISHRSGLYIEWDFTRGLSELSVGDTLPLFDTHNGLVILSRMTDSDITELAAWHNERFGRSNRVIDAEVIARVRPLRGRDYISGRSPGYPQSASICFYLSDDHESEELLLSVIVPVSRLSACEASVVANVRRSLQMHVSGTMIDPSCRHCAEAKSKTSELDVQSVWSR